MIKEGTLEIFKCSKKKNSKYDRYLFLKYCVISYYMTLLEGLGMCLHVYDKKYRLFSVHLVVRRGEIEFTIYIIQS